jgi:hypothetical protein
MKKYFLILCAAVTLALSCNKDDDKDSTAINKENLAGSYTLTSAKATVSGIDIDLTAASIFLPVPVISACQKDDIITLKADYTYTWQDAGQTCTPSGNISGAWALSGNNTITINGVSFVPGATSISGTIDKYDGKSLTIKDTASIPIGSTTQQIPVTIVFTKQ